MTDSSDSRSIRLEEAGSTTAPPMLSYLQAYTGEAITSMDGYTAAGGQGPSLADFRKWFNIYHLDRQIGKISVYYTGEEDILRRRGRLDLYIEQEENRLAAEALSLLCRYVHAEYHCLYCIIPRHNAPCLRTLRDCGFNSEKDLGSHLMLSRPLK